MESTNNLVQSDPNENRKSDVQSFKTMNFKQRLSFVKDLITVEPLIICYIIPSLICGPALETLELEKACKANAAYDDEICDKIVSAQHENYTNVNKQVQLIITNLHSWQYPMQSFVPLLLILFLASYSDRHKIRKPFLLLPIFGEFFAVAGCVLCVVFMRQLPIEFLGFCQTVVPSFLGGPTMLLMALYAYVSDVSTAEQRTLRIGLIQIVYTVCSTFLRSVGGILFAKCGYIVVLIIGGFMYFVGLCYGYFCIKETNTRPKYSDFMMFLTDLFRPKHALEIITFLFKKNVGVNRVLLFLIMSVYLISFLVTFGEVTVFGLYMQHVFKYTPVDTSYYDSIKMGINVLGQAIFVPLFSNVFKFHDTTVTVISFVDKILSNLVLIFYNTVPGLYVAAVVGNCAGIANVALRSQLTKTVTKENLAKALSLLSICEIVASTIATPIYNEAVYNNTLDTYPSAFFFLGIILIGLSIVVVLSLYCCRCGRNLLENQQEAPRMSTEMEPKNVQVTKM